MKMKKDYEEEKAQSLVVNRKITDENDMLKNKLKTKEECIK